ncbi:HEPN domain-containing protein [candidate division WOR-3 bacterium]|nr:HEPN domain-containing protein [candidate division WOR-3 bacterium]
MKAETARLLDKAQHAIRAAEILLDADERDFAAGRAYYAMFYVAEALLVERGKRFRKHSAVHAAYGDQFGKSGILEPKYHRWLLDAFDRRIVSDYDTTGEISPHEVREMINRAKEFLAQAAGFLGRRRRPATRSDR